NIKAPMSKITPAVSRTIVPISRETGQKDLETLIARIKAELAEGTAKGTLIRTLVKNGWDRQEAAQFVKQIAYELTTNPEDALLLIKRYKKYMLFGGTATIGGLVAVLYGASGIPLAGIIFVLWGFVGWMAYGGRLRPDNQGPVNRAITFRPSGGSLQFTRKSMSLVLRISIAVFAALCLFFLVLAIVFEIWGPK
ncbi:MAG: hypothetical protein M1305_05605, partial [Candidatus Marsarchaeota archaeon]|nr:hypothetical protein [Candidatus Marsarchaeota archaeon]